MCREFEIGDRVSTDYGIAVVASTRLDDDDDQEIGIVVDGGMAWVPAHTVQRAR